MTCTPPRSGIGLVDQDLRECCLASLFASAGRGKRSDRRDHGGRPLRPAPSPRRFSEPNPQFRGNCDAVPCPAGAAEGGDRVMGRNAQFTEECPQMSSHEPLQFHRSVASSSNRTFGLVFAAVFAIVAFWPALRHGEALRWWALGVAVIFLGLCSFRPGTPRAAKSPVVQAGPLFAFGGLPAYHGAAVLWRGDPDGLTSCGLWARDLLRLRSHGELKRSPRIVRDPRGPAAGSMKNQF